MKMTFKEKMYFFLFKNLAVDEGMTIDENLAIKCIKNLLENEDFLYELFLDSKQATIFTDLCINEDFSKIIEDKISKRILKDTNGDIVKCFQICTNEKQEYQNHKMNMFLNILKLKAQNHELSQDNVDELAKYLSTQVKSDDRETNIDAGFICSIEEFFKKEIDVEYKSYFQNSFIKLINEKIAGLESFNELQKRSLSNIIARKINNSEFEIYTAYDSVFNQEEEFLHSIARIGDVSLSFLTKEQIANINVKNVNQVISAAEEKFDKLRLLDKQRIIKLNILFGKQKTLELIEGRYGDFSLETLEQWMIDEVKIDDYKINPKTHEVEYDESQKKLVNFLFASGPTDVNANIKKVLSGVITIEELPIHRLINEWRVHYSFLKGVVNINNVIEQLSGLEIILPPNLQEISPILRMAGLDAYNAVKESYFDMNKRNCSSIPKVKGKLDDLEYEILDLNDLEQMSVGYRTYCCFTFDGASSDSFKSACRDEDSRIFVLKKNNAIVAQSWVWRNGNIVCFDNIEIVGTSKDKQRDEQFYKAYEEAAHSIMDVSSKEEPVQAVTIGIENTKIAFGDAEKLATRKVRILPRRRTYTDADTQIMVASSNDYNGPIPYKAKPIYQDARQQVMFVDPQQSSEHDIEVAKRHIDKINYSVSRRKFKPTEVSKEYTFVACGQDWFIGITPNGDINTQSYSTDSRSEQEIKIQLELIQTKIKEGTLSNYLNDMRKNNSIQEGIKK